MTQEDKDLLLKDLCARLPYGVKVEVNYTEGKIIKELTGYINIGNKDICAGFSWMSISDDIKPYLRPMSSMTEEERKEFIKFRWTTHDGEPRMYEWCDYANAYHFDYCGLIEKGLALEAPKGMYNLKDE